MFDYDTHVCKYATVQLMDKWTEFKTAYRLAKLGTLSATAEDLAIHRSTVMRHIDALEQNLGVKLFQRNDKGYLPTDAGLELMRLGEITDTHFTQFVNKSRNIEDVVEGVLKITCVNELAVALFPTVKQFQSSYPKVQVEILGDIRKFDLEYGEADLAIRTGDKPNTLDNVVIPFVSTEVVFAVHKSYVELHRMPNKENYLEHKFVANTERVEHLYWNEWIHQNVQTQNIAVVSTSHQVLTNALEAGCGISISTPQSIAANDDLIQVDLGQSWTVDTWILVHRDIINIPKVRKFVDLLKNNASEVMSL